MVWSCHLAEYGQLFRISRIVNFPLNVPLREFLKSASNVYCAVYLLQRDGRLS